MLRRSEAVLPTTPTWEGKEPDVKWEITKISWKWGPQPVSARPGDTAQEQEAALSPVGPKPTFLPS